MLRYILLAFIILSSLTCTRKLTRHVVRSGDDLITMGRSYDAKSVESKSCNESSAYIPGDHKEIRKKYVRVNIHFMNSTDSLHNHNGEEAIRFAKSLIGNSNERLFDNKPMRKPRDEKHQASNPQYQYRLTTYDSQNGDIYFHYDDALYYFLNKGKGRNNYTKEVINKYAVRSDSVVNVFIMPHHPDTLKRDYYRGGNAGIALGHSVKLAGAWLSKPSWHFGTLFNHELGHVFGLRHTWNENDGCDDTPKHKQCWDCSAAGNNMMDYNNSQMAITACQIGRVHRSLSRLTYDQRELVIPDWCHYNAKHDVIISRDTHWQGERDIAGDIIVKKGATLTLTCRVSMPSEGRIDIMPGGKLILDGCKLHNSCGYTWGGIHTIEVNGKRGEILYRNDPMIEDVAVGNQ